MTRFHYFNYLYPNQAKDIHEGYQAMSTTMWNAFTKATGLSRFFKFTPSEIDTPDQGAAQGQGIQSDTNNAL